MKVFAFILSLYILILVAIPCVDVPPNHALQKNELSQNANSHHHNDSDTCSPFCVCSCCVSPISHLIYRVSFTCYSSTRIQFNTYTSFFTSYNTASIWQPPKLIWNLFIHSSLLVFRTLKALHCCINFLNQKFLWLNVSFIFQ